MCWHSIHSISVPIFRMPVPSFRLSDMNEIAHDTGSHSQIRPDPQQLPLPQRNANCKNASACDSSKNPGSYVGLGGYLFIRLLDDVEGGRYILRAPDLQNDPSLF
jgi:hypothetical protein